MRAHREVTILNIIGCQFDRQADLNKTVCSQTPPNKRRTEKVLPQTSQTDEGAEENSESNENGKNNISFPNEQDKAREESFGIQEQKDNDFQAGPMLNEALGKFGKSQTRKRKG